MGDFTLTFAVTDNARRTVNSALSLVVRRATPSEKATQIDAGDLHSCASLSSGTVKCWGASIPAQVGDATFNDPNMPVSVVGLSEVTAVATAWVHSCALLSGGTVKCWGFNGLGQLGHGFGGGSRTPVSVVGLSGVTAIAVGSYQPHSCALLSSGMVKCWGANYNGSLGDGTVEVRRTPVSVIGLSGVTAITAGDDHSCALLSSGTVKCWGDNSDGQLGDGTVEVRTSPVSVPGLVGVIALDTGRSHSCAVLSGGTVKCWGRNYGQLGDGTTWQWEPVPTTPVSVVDLSGAVGVAVGSGHSCALLSGGTVKCWGVNLGGQLGDGTTINRLTPVSVVGLSGVTAITAGPGHTCALLSSGAVKCWGENSYGQLGDGTTESWLVPISVVGIG